MYKNKKTGTIGIIITIIILIIIVLITNTNIRKFTKLENVFSKLVMPIQNGLTYLKNKMANNDSFFQSIDSLRAENDKLKEENKNLKKELEETQIIKAENKILREFSGLAEQYSEHETVAAYIINRDISNLSDTFIINVGTENGVTADMAVIGEEGLIGYIISATSNTAKVQPIIDAASSVSGTLTASKGNVIVKGQVDSDTELKVMSLQTDGEMVIGDVIETSGLGGIYPKGIKIGTIKEVVETKNTAERYAILETSVDFKNLEYVLVIKK